MVAAPPRAMLVASAEVAGDLIRSMLAIGALLTRWPGGRAVLPTRARTTRVAIAGCLRPRKTFHTRSDGRSRVIVGVVFRVRLVGATSLAAGFGVIRFLPDRTRAVAAAATRRLRVPSNRAPHTER